MQLEYLYRDLKKLLQYVLMLSFLKLVFKRLKKQYNVQYLQYLVDTTNFAL